MIAQRFIVPVTVISSYGSSANLQGYVGVNVDRIVVQPAPRGDPPPTADLYDAIVAPGTPPPTPYYYHAEMLDDGSIVVKRDLFAKGVFAHTFAGWPVPGDSPPSAMRAVAGLQLPHKWRKYG